ncbi:uncharacterized protein [Eurosta solidaginis]|uniref:uncharacterized protein n=1 Tax=Eurosta solidaginis TaxID=178769 RepID=UPI00353095C6
MLLARTICDEVVVESSLYIKPKVNMRPQVRRVRSIPFDMPLTSASLLEHIRVKRVLKYQSLPPQYGQSQATANAAAHDIKYVRYGTNTAASNAGAQAFNTFGPNGSFGAFSAGTISQATQMGPLGVQNSVGASLSQTYTLPNGQTINFASTNSFANGPFGNNANSRGSSVAVSKLKVVACKGDQHSFVGGYIFEGFHNYGLSATEVDADQLITMMKHCLNELPIDKPKMLPGAYTPLVILELIALGVDIFDTAM